MPFVFAALLAAAPLAHAAETNSDRYQWLETPSAKRTEFVKAHIAAMDARQKADPNYTAIEYWQRQIHGETRIINQATLDPTHSVILRSMGIGQPTELVLDSPDDEKLLATDKQAENTPRSNIIGFGVSPDQKTVFVTTEKDGSIDRMEVSLIDLATGASLLREPLRPSENAIAWFSSTELFYDSYDPKTRVHSATIYDLRTGKRSTIAGGNFTLDSPRYVIYYSAAAKGELLHDKTDQTDTPILCGPEKVVEGDDQGATVFCSGNLGMGEIRRFNKAPGATTMQEGTTIVPQLDVPMRSVNLAGSSYFVMVRNGGDRWMLVYDLSGREQALIKEPDCCAITAMQWGEPGKTLLVSMMSAIDSVSNMLYTLSTGTWNRDPETLLTSTIDGAQYKSEVVSVTSHDGAQVPLRLTYRADLVPDHSHPVYFMSYGGFGNSGFLDPSDQADNEVFLHRGGILAGAGLRGGDEFAPYWHEEAMLADKINTYYDLDAAAKYVVQQGWSTPQKVVSLGTSNGGLTVSATALLFPADFGLVIPIAGVDDFLGRDRMDPQFAGWDPEYGSATDPNLLTSMTAISPLENAKNLGSLHFLIIDGLDDTRVNHAHSLKLQAALEELGGSAGWSALASYRDAGHAMTEYTYQNSISLHVNALIWTAIFNQAGWKW